MSSSVLDQTLIEAFHHIRFDADTPNHAANTTTAHWLTRTVDPTVINRPRSRNMQCMPSDDEEEDDEQIIYQSSDDEEVEEAHEKARLRAQLDKKKMKSNPEMATHRKSTVPLPSEDELSTDGEVEEEEDEDEDDDDDDDDNDNLLSVKLNTSMNKKLSLQPPKNEGLNLMLPFNRSAPTLAQAPYPSQPQPSLQQRHSSDNSQYKQRTPTAQNVPQILLENRSISTDDLTSRYYSLGHKGMHSGSSSSHSGSGNASRGGAEGGNGEGEEDYFTAGRQISSSAASSSSHSSPKMHLSMQQQSQSPYQPYQPYHQPHYPSHLGAVHTTTNTTNAMQQKRNHQHPHSQPHTHPQPQQAHPHQHQQQVRALSGMELIKQREQEKADAKRQNNKLPRLMNPAQMEAKIEGGLLSRLPQQGTHNINFQQIQQQHEEQMKKYKKEQLQLQQQMAQQQQQQQQQIMMMHGYPLYDYYYQQQQPTQGLYQLPHLNNSHGSMYMAQQQQLQPINRPGSALSSSNNNKQRPGTPATSGMYSQYH